MLPFPLFWRIPWALFALFILMLRASAQAPPALGQDEPRLAVQAGHTAPVNAIAISGDNRLLLSAGSDGVLKLWDIETGGLLRTLTGHTGTVSAAAFRADGREAASGGEDGTAKLWDTATGTVPRTLTGTGNGVLAVAFSPDGRRVAGGGMDGRVRVWDAATGRILRLLTAGAGQAQQMSLTFSPDGQTLAGALEADKSRGLTVWDIGSGRKRFFVPNAGVAAFRHDGTRLAYLRDDLSAVERDLNGGAARVLRSAAPPQFRYVQNLTTLAYSAGDAALVGVSPKRLDVWTLSTGVLRSAPRDGGSSPALSPDARLLADSRHADDSPDGSSVAVTLCAVDTGQPLRTLAGRVGAIHAVAFAPAGRTLAIASDDPTIKLWDLTAGGETGRLAGQNRAVATVALAPDGKRLASGGMEAAVRSWDWAAGRSAWRQDANASSVNSVAFSPNGRLLADGGWHGTITLRDAATGRQIRLLTGHPEHEWNTVLFSPDSRLLAAIGDDGALVVWPVATGRIRVVEKGRSTSEDSLDCPICFSPDGRLLVYGSPDGPIRLHDTRSGHVLGALAARAGDAADLAFSPDGRLLAASGAGVTLWDVAARRPARVLPSGGERVGPIAFSPNGRMLAGGVDASVFLWDVSAGRPLCRLLSFTGGDWVVVAPDGRFDTNSLDNLPFLHWVLPDAPFTPLPLEAFMRQYYEPRLLPRLLAGEALPPIPSIASLNRVQPLVQITGVTAHPEDPAVVDVTVEAQAATGTFHQDGQDVVKTSGVYDLRLFRNGQLAGSLPAGEEEEGGAPADLAGGAAAHTFTVRLPRDGGQSAEFRAYAFNRDRVKSRTDRRAYALPQPLPVVKGRVYIVSLGVNAYEDPHWNLRFAANDARRLQSALGVACAQTGQFAQVVSIPLISDHSVVNGQPVLEVGGAAKQTFHAVLDLLAGKPVDPAVMQTIPHADQVRKAQPEDLLLLTFSCHGAADKAGGDFYVFPYDIGPHQQAGLTDDLKRHALSSRELSRWLRDVDAGTIAMIVDACHSAASVDAGGFKPGPMGSRGLGQLAYDKGMQILAASQADNVALESDKLGEGHGLLTWALVHDGLDAAQADLAPKDGIITLSKWLRYGAARVPALYQEVQAGAVQSFGRDAPRGTEAVETAAERAHEAAVPVQQPSLFDFNKQKRDVRLAPAGK